MTRSTMIRPCWDVAVHLVPIRPATSGPGPDALRRTIVLVDPGLELPGVHVLEATTVTVAGRTLLERLVPTSGGPATGTLATLIGALRGDGSDGAGGDAVGSVPIAVDGTPFTVTVLEALARVPFGTRCTYAELAAAAGRPRAVRATASVMARNRVPMLLPCHRVVPASGGTGRYGWGEDAKVALLAAEEGCA